VSAVNAVFFGVYGSALSRLRLDVDDVGSSLTRHARYVYVAGCVAGLAQTVVACPSDLIKVVLQSQLHSAAGKRRYARFLYGEIYTARRG